MSNYANKPVSIAQKKLKKIFVDDRPKKAAISQSCTGQWGPFFLHGFPLVFFHIPKAHRLGQFGYFELSIGVNMRVNDVHPCVSPAISWWPAHGVPTKSH